MNTDTLSMSTRTYVALGVLLVVLGYIFLNRFEFIHFNGALVIRCSYLSGECIYFEAADNTL